MDAGSAAAGIEDEAMVQFWQRSVERGNQYHTTHRPNSTHPLGMLAECPQAVPRGPWGTAFRGRIGIRHLE